MKYVMDETCREALHYHHELTLINSEEEIDTYIKQFRQK